MKKIIFLLFAITSLVIADSTPCESTLQCYAGSVDKLQRGSKLYKDGADQIQQQLDNILAQLDQSIQKIKDDNDKLSNLINVQEQELAELTKFGLPTEREAAMYKEAIIYDDIFELFNVNNIYRIGNPTGWDQNTYSSNLWNFKKMISIGSGNNSNGNGLSVKVPVNYDVIWVRLAGNQFSSIRATTNDFTISEKFACGNRGLNEIAPDGTVKDSSSFFHQWCPIPVRRNRLGDVVYDVYSDSGNQVWVSGIAFSKNPWGHAKNSAVAYYWALNGGGNVQWESDIWNSDQLGVIKNGAINELIVPIVPNGKDKLFYIIEYNSNWSGIVHKSIFANDIEIERLRATYSNPFAHHYNGKLFDRYLAARIPNKIIGKNQIHISIKIDMTDNDSSIFFREAGTHDLF